MEPEWNVIRDRESGRVDCGRCHVGYRRLSDYKETRWQASRHKQELEQETIKGTRTGEERQPPNEGLQHHSTATGRTRLLKRQTATRLPGRCTCTTPGPSLH